jgi:hypothetical protein
VNPPAEQQENNFNLLPNRNIAKKEAPADKFYAPIRAEIRDFKSEKSSEPEQQFYRPTPSAQYKRGRSIYRSTAEPQFELTPPAHFERAREAFLTSSESFFADDNDNDDVAEYQQTPSSQFESDRTEFHSTPPFEPVRADVRPFEPENSEFVTPTEATRFEVTQNKFARQVKPEIYTERPVSRPEPFNARPVNSQESYQERPVIPPFNRRPETYSERPAPRIEPFNLRPVEPFSGRPDDRPEPFDQRSVNHPQQQQNYQQQQQHEQQQIKNHQQQQQHEQQQIKHQQQQQLQQQPKFDSISLTRPESFVDNRNNEIESFSSEFSAEPTDFEKVRPNNGDPSTDRPDPFEFHQKIASQFDGNRADNDDDNEIVFSGSRRYENDPIRVTDPPVFVDKHLDSMEAPIQSETFESDPQSRLVGRHWQHLSAEEPESNYAIYDPVKFRNFF